MRSKGGVEGSRRWWLALVIATVVSASAALGPLAAAQAEEDEGDAPPPPAAELIETPFGAMSVAGGSALAVTMLEDGVQIESSGYISLAVVTRTFYLRPGDALLFRKISGTIRVSVLRGSAQVLLGVEEVTLTPNVNLGMNDPADLEPDEETEE